MTDMSAALNARLMAAGASKTIYAFVMPETEIITDRVMDGGTGDPAHNREALREWYREAWTKKQDPMHHEFLDAWLEWSRDVVSLDARQFPFQYPSAGASEALRDFIQSYGNHARVAGFEPAIHVFDGDYEGYAAYAAACGIPVVNHDRAQWQKTIMKIGPNDQFYISQPSAIDGDLWQDYDAFMTTLDRSQPTAKVVLDLTYVGAVADPYHVNASYPNVGSVVFSLSKPMGAYYHRIGGAFCREEKPSLYGNAWFKSIFALKLGTELMKAAAVQDLPRKYRNIQRQAATDVGQALGLDLTLSDVWLLATANQARPGSDIEQFLKRGTGENAPVRVCLTPRIAQIVRTPR